jgi:hypothetical protein
MATKKNIKVRDLKPSKDAKGGGVTRNAGHLNTGRDLNTGGLNSDKTNTKGHQHHGSHGHN